MILIVVFGFVIAGYFRLRDNFAQEKLQAAVAMRMQLLMPQLEPPLTATLREVAPYYMDMGRDRLQKIAPKLDGRVQQEADKLGKDLEQQMGAQLDVFFAKLNKSASAELTESFPALTADGGARASAKLNELLASEAGSLETQGKTLYEAKARQVRESLAKFPVADVKQADLDTLNRQLLHDLLMLADYEMTAHASDAVKADARKQ